MAGKTGGTSRPKTGKAALEASRARLDSGQEVTADTIARDSAGVGRISYTLDERQRQGLADARSDDKERAAGQDAEMAFWAAMGDTFGFVPTTVNTDDATIETGEFTAIPTEAIGDDPRPATADLPDQHERAIERMERAASEAELDTSDLVGDVSAFLLDQIKCRPKPWSATAEIEQHDVAAACDHAAKELVRKIVEGLAAGGRDNVRVLLTKITLGDDMVIAGKVKLLDPSEEDEAVKLLNHNRGKHVLLIPASADDYQGQGRDPGIMPDEPGLNFEAGTGEPDPE